MTTAATGFGQNIKHHLAGLALFTVHGIFYRTWDDEEANTRIYSTFEALPRVFSGIIRYQSRTPTKTDTSFDIVTSYETQTNGL